MSGDRAATVQVVRSLRRYRALVHAIKQRREVQPVTAAFVAGIADEIERIVEVES
jgi:hypothetical protein